jgi:hypothetical protein
MYFLYKNDCRSLNLVEVTQQMDKGRKEKNREDEPIQIIIHTYMKMSQ